MIKMQWSKEMVEEKRGSGKVENTVRIREVIIAKKGGSRNLNL